MRGGQVTCFTNLMLAFVHVLLVLPACLILDAVHLSPGGFVHGNSLAGRVPVELHDTAPYFWLYQVWNTLW